MRGKLYELLSSCLPPDKIVRSLTQALMAKLPVPTTLAPTPTLNLTLTCRPHPPHEKK